MPTPLERDIQWASFAQHLTDQTPVFDRQILDQIEQAQHTIHNQVGWAPNMPTPWDAIFAETERAAVRRWEQMTGNHIINEQQIKIVPAPEPDGIYG